MSRKPKINRLKFLFDQQKDFELTDAEYEKYTDARLPKDIYYLKNKSAVAKMCKEHGFKIEVIEKRIIMKKLAG